MPSTYTTGAIAMKLNRCSVAVLSATLILSACSPSPSSVMKNSYMAISAGKIDEALVQFDFEQAAGVGVSRENLKAALIKKSDRLHIKECDGLADVQILSEDIRGDIATQRIRLVCKTGATRDEDGKLMKGKDGWRLVVF